MSKEEQIAKLSEDIAMLDQQIMALKPERTQKCNARAALQAKFAVGDIVEYGWNGSLPRKGKIEAIREGPQYAILRILKSGRFGGSELWHEVGHETARIMRKVDA